VRLLAFAIITATIAGMVWLLVSHTALFLAVAIVCALKLTHDIETSETREDGVGELADWGSKATRFHGGYK
jgi:hypothetical protein